MFFRVLWTLLAATNGASMTLNIVTDSYAVAAGSNMAWREDVNRQANGNQFAMAVSAAAIAPKSDRWCGYWQR